MARGQRDVRVPRHGGRRGEPAAEVVAGDEVGEPGRSAGRGHQGIELLLAHHGVDAFEGGQPAAVGEGLDVGEVGERPLLLRLEEEVLAEVRHLFRPVRLVERDDVGQRAHGRLGPQRRQVGVEVRLQLVEQHGQLRRLGDAEEFSVLDAQRAGLRSLAVGHVDFGGLTVPCRAVDDRVAVGS